MGFRACRGYPLRSHLVARLSLEARLIAAAPRPSSGRLAGVLVSGVVRRLPVLYGGIAKKVWGLLWARASSAGLFNPVRRAASGCRRDLGRRGSPLVPPDAARGLVDRKRADAAGPPAGCSPLTTPARG